jgi:plastocyanin
MNMYGGRRRLLTLAIALLAVSPQGTPARAAVSGVDEAANSYSPKRVEIAVNDKVVWTNRSSGTHTVTFDDGTDLHSTCDPKALLRVGCQGPGATVERTFRAPGAYQYYCKFHGGRGGAGMSGVVVVLGTSTSATSPASTTTTAKASTTSTTKATTSSTTATTRPLATSSTVTTLSTTTTTSESTSVLLPGEPPPFSDDASSAAGKRGGSEGGSDSGTVALIVGLLLAVSAGGGLLLWRLRPSRP